VHASSATLRRPAYGCHTAIETNTKRARRGQLTKVIAKRGKVGRQDGPSRAQPPRLPAAQNDEKAPVAQNNDKALAAQNDNEVPGRRHPRPSRTMTLPPRLPTRRCSRSQTMTMTNER
jgi:hypothetical protein